ncbi:12897_t:CDS:1, partial [Gigaspora margarita]
MFCIFENLKISNNEKNPRNSSLSHAYLLPIELPFNIIDPFNTVNPQQTSNTINPQQPYIIVNPQL